MAQKTELNDSADPGGFHELSKRPGQAPGDEMTALEPGLAPDIAAKGEPETDSSEVCDDPPTGSQR